MSEIELSAIRAQGAGGQNVNKVATAIHLRFDVMASSLPDRYKYRLMQLRVGSDASEVDRRITNEGIVIIKSHSRTQSRGRIRSIEIAHFKRSCCYLASETNQTQQRAKSATLGY